MHTLDGTAGPRSSASAAGLHWLIELDFLSGTQYFTTFNVTLSVGGHDYMGLGDILEVSVLNESEDNTADRVEFAVPIVNTAMLATLIGPATEYRGLRARMYGQFIDDTFKPAGAAVLRWAGFMDVVRTEREAPAADGIDAATSGKIILPCWRAGQAGMRRANSLRRTHAQQLQRTAGADTGLRYTQPLIETPSLWLSKRFQETQT